jgi:hypothetical protein
MKKDLREERRRGGGGEGEGEGGRQDQAMDNEEDGWMDGWMKREGASEEGFGTEAGYYVRRRKHKVEAIDRDMLRRQGAKRGRCEGDGGRKEVPDLGREDTCKLKAGIEGSCHICGGRVIATVCDTYDRTISHPLKSGYGKEAVRVWRLEGVPSQSA